MGSSKVFMTSSVTSACNVSGFSLSWKPRWLSKPGDCTIIPNGHTARWPIKPRRLSPLSSSSNLLKLSFRLDIFSEAGQTQVSKGGKAPAGQQGIQCIEQGIATFLENARLHRLTKFGKDVKVLFVRSWNAHNPQVSTKGRFCPRAKLPPILSKLEFLINRQRFAQISREVGIQPAQDGHVIRKQL